MSYYHVLGFCLILVLLLLLSAFFSATETALMAVNQYRLRHKARMKKRYAIQILALLKRPDRLLGTILIGNTFANILASSLATVIAMHLWGEKSAILVAIALTFIVLIFSEVAPKTFAALYPDLVSRWVAYPTQWLLKLFYPAVWLANAAANALLRLVNIRVSQVVTEPLSREELRSVVYETAGKISREYQNMLLTILDLNQLTVDDVMLPRHEMIGLDLEQPWDKVIAEITASHQEWLPVYRGNINQTAGVLYAKDGLRALLTHKIINKESLLQFIYEPYFVPEGTALNTQLTYFQKTEHKMAFVVDEYGEIQGVLTLNDILEEIVGDFTTQFSRAHKKRIHPEPDGSYLLDGAIGVREFNRHSGWDLPSHGPRTLNGLITEHLEALPHQGTTILISGHPIEIIKVEDNRVKLARIFPAISGKEIR